MPNRRLLSALSLLLILQTPACSNRPNPNPVVPVTPNPTPSEETRLFLRKQCLLSESQELAPPTREGVAAIFIPLLINKALGFAIDALRKAGSDEVIKKIGHTPTYLYTRTAANPPRLELNQAFGCLILIHGSFGKTGGEELDKSKSKPVFSQAGMLAAEGADAERIKRLGENGIPVTSVSMLAELRIEQAEDFTAFRYEPRFLWVGKFLGSRSSPKRGVVVNVAIVGAGPKPEEPVLSAAIVNFGEIERKIYGPDHRYPAPRTTPWAGGLGLSKDSAEAFKTLGSNPGVTRYMPVTLIGAFAETAEGSAIAKFIADLLDAGKKDIAKLANETINPEEREKAAEGEASTRTKLADTVTTTYKDFLAANAALETAVAAVIPTAPLKEDRRKSLDFEITRTKRLFCNAWTALKKEGGGSADIPSEISTGACATN